MKNKVLKIVTTIMSVILMVCALGLSTLLVMGTAGVYPFLDSNYRQYTANFYNEGVLVYTETLERGGKLTYNERPSRDPAEDGTIYTFIGWDYTGDNIIDIIPQRMYFNFNAKAIYMPIKIPSLSDIDLETLLELLEKLNISWEDLMEMFNLSEDQLRELALKPVFDYYSDLDSSKSLSNLAYFRTISYGNKYDKKTQKWNYSPRYDVKNISEGSVNPLQYTSDKVYMLSSGSSIVDYPISFVRYHIEYKKAQKDYYPVSDCELENTQGLSTDSYSLTKCKDLVYEDEGIFCPATEMTINLLKQMRYSVNAIARDELNTYRPFVYDNYLDVPDNYRTFFVDKLEEKGIDFNGSNYKVVDQVREWISTSAKLNQLASYKKAEDAVLKPFTDKDASDLHFNNAAVMAFRTLGIPARLVKGYFSQTEEGALNTVCIANQHYWCEIYIPEIGWMSADCTSTDISNETDVDGDLDDISSDNDVDNSADKDGTKGEGNDSKPVSEDLSSDLSKTGPGDKSDIQTIFEFTSSYQGTAYFRSRSYDTYSNGSWESTYESTSTQYSPLTYAYQTASHYLEADRFDIVYKQKMANGVSPMYSERLNNNNSDVYSSVPVKEEDRVSVNGISIMATTDNVNLLRSAASDNSYNYQDDISSYNSKAHSYYTYVPNEYRSYLESSLIAYGIYPYSGDVVFDQLKLYFANNYTYNIDFAAYPDNVDPLLYFATVSHEGICNHFASLGVYVLRTLGYPARYVAGYGANSNGEGVNNVVNSATAHAWVEVYIDDVGWLTFDPTGFDDGRGSNDGQGNGGDNSGIYGEGFGGEGVAPTYQQRKIKLPNRFEKVYDGTPWSVSSININSDELDLYPGDTFEIISIGAMEGVYYAPEKGAIISYKILNDKGIDVTSTRYSLTGTLRAMFVTVEADLTISLPEIEIGEYEDITNYLGYEAYGLCYSDYIDASQLVYIYPETGNGIITVDLDSIHIYNSYNGQEVTDAYIIGIEAGEVIRI